MIQSNKDSLILVLYSSIFLIVLETIILNISHQFFLVFNSLPLLIIGQFLKINLYLITLIISNIIFFVITFSDYFVIEKNLSINFYLNYAFVSFLVFCFFFICNFISKKENSADKILWVFTILVQIFSILLIYFYFSSIDYSSIQSYLAELSRNLVKENNQVLTTKSIEEIIKVIPSINALIFLTTLMVNQKIAVLINRKLELGNKYILNFGNYVLPKWFFLIFFALSLSSILVENNSQTYLINSLIILSFVFLFNGFIKFYKSFDRFNLNGYVKFLIIFLLFIFLGYVLILIIFFLGFYTTFKNCFIKNSENI